MITVGLIKELYFIAKTLNRAYTMEIFASNALWGGKVAPLKVEIKPTGELDVWYQATHIWNESLDENEFFGVESCDTISRIVACINNKDFTWRERYPFGDIQKNLDKPTNGMQAASNE
jgi:hypothetical protein